MEQVRERTLEVLDGIELDPADPLLADGFVYEMLLAHEYQHNETVLQLLQMVESYEPVEVDRKPVTNADYITFLEETRSEPPLYWERDGEGGWVRKAMGRTQEVDPRLPVVHVSWDEAGAFASWAGKRLPSEPEWEAAAEGASRERANLDQLSFGPAPAGAYADAASSSGAVQMLGDVWEWTSSSFTAYPGFEAFPYPEYSEVFFGDEHKVLRGGAWATRRDVIRTSFRNWDLPMRRQIFSGIRCASNDV